MHIVISIVAMNLVLFLAVKAFSVVWRNLVAVPKFVKMFETHAQNYKALGDEKNLERALWNIKNAKDIVFGRTKVKLYN